MQIVSFIFRKVADALYKGASIIGVTYNEINIIVYFTDTANMDYPV